jgi:limonene-1,2-epoxide hydrolase
VPDVGERVLRSDFLLAHTSAGWITFRDVVAVDGRPVAMRDERLRRLFLEAGPDSPVEVLEQISRESTRYNLAGIGSINLPLNAVSFLQQQYISRFRFTVQRRATDYDGDVWVVSYEERVRPTVFRGPRRTDLPVTGLLWIDEASGVVRRTELRVILVDSGVRNESVVVTDFGFSAELQTHVPLSMQETHRFGVGEVVGRAEYGTFRNFRVTTSDAVASP